MSWHLKDLEHEFDRRQDLAHDIRLIACFDDGNDLKFSATFAEEGIDLVRSRPLLCECGASLKLIDVLEARTQSDVVGKILTHIKFAFEALSLPVRPPPPSSNSEQGEAQEDGSLSEACCF